MKQIWSAPGPALVLYFASAALAGCAAAAQEVPPAPSVAQPNAGMVLEQQISSHCAGFASNFDQTIACQRAEGTIETFENPGIEWRVRYFVRYAAMPCGEFPTVQEGYAYHMIVNDLNHDGDLNGIQRTTIRNAMFTGKPHCP